MFTQVYVLYDAAVCIILIRLLILQGCNEIKFGYASSKEPQEFTTIVYWLWGKLRKINVQVIMYITIPIFLLHFFKSSINFTDHIKVKRMERKIILKILTVILCVI